MSRRAIFLLAIVLGLGWLATHPAHRSSLQARVTGSVERLLSRRELLATERRIEEEMRLSRAGNPSAMARVASYMLDPATIPPETRQRMGLSASRPEDGWILLRRAASRGESRARYEVWKSDGGSTHALRSIVESWYGPGLYPAAAELARRALPGCDRRSMRTALQALGSLTTKSLGNDARERRAPGMARGEVSATRRGFEEACGPG